MEQLEEFYFYQDIFEICEDLDIPGATTNFCLYIKRCIEQKIPIILYSQNQLNIAKELVTWAHTLNEVEIKVDEQENVDVCCKHYPYTCDEVTSQKNLYNYGCHKQTFSCCDCRGDCSCDDGPRTHFVAFSWNNCYMKHRDNCYEDCCSHSIVFKRFVITILHELETIAQDPLCNTGLVVQDGEIDYIQID